MWQENKFDSRFKKYGFFFVFWDHWCIKLYIESFWVFFSHSQHTSASQELQKYMNMCGQEVRSESTISCEIGSASEGQLDFDWLWFQEILAENSINLISANCRFVSPAGRNKSGQWIVVYIVFSVYTCRSQNFSVITNSFYVL